MCCKERSPSVSASSVRLQRNISSTLDTKASPTALVERDNHKASTNTLARAHSTFLGFQAAMNLAEKAAEHDQVTKQMTLPSRPSSSSTDNPGIPHVARSRSNPSANFSSNNTTVNNVTRSPSDQHLNPSAIEQMDVTGLRSSPLIDDEEDPDEGDVSMPSINQLRAAGDSRRFGDEMHYLLEGLEDGHPLAVHRARSVNQAPQLRGISDTMYTVSLKS